MELERERITIVYLFKSNVNSFVVSSSNHVFDAIHHSAYVNFCLLASRFHEFLKLENEIGNITRQEAVSMVSAFYYSFMFCNTVYLSLISFSFFLFLHMDVFMLLQFFYSGSSPLPGCTTRALCS